MKFWPLFFCAKNSCRYTGLKFHLFAAVLFYMKTETKTKRARICFWLHIKKI